MEPSTESPTKRPLSGKTERTKKIIKHFYFYEDELLGKGTSGTVYRGYDTKNNDTPVAVKVIPCNNIDEQGFTMLNREVEILYVIKGSNVVRLHETAQTKNNFYVIMEYCNGPTLSSYLAKNGKLPEEEALNILKQITEAFSGLDKIETGEIKKKEYAIMHRDLKPANILFHDKNVKIADFGYAKIVSRITKSISLDQTYCGTPLYAAPQILQNSPYCYRCDVWSAGCILYECLYGKVPFMARTEVALVDKILEGKLEFPSEVKVSAETKDLLKKMLTVDEDRRFAWVNVKLHPAIKNLK